MKDERIAKLLEALDALAEGARPVLFDGHGDDDLAQLERGVARVAKALDARQRRFDELVGLLGGLSVGTALDEVLERVYDTFRNVIPYDRIGCALLEDGGRLVRAVWARSTASRLEIERDYTACLAPDSSLARILETGEPRILNDLETYLADHPASDSTHRIVVEGMRSSLTCPLISMRRPVGFLFFSSRHAGTYEEAHVTVFSRIAGHVSTVIEKTRLYEELLATKRELEAANSQLTHLAVVDGLTGVANRRSFDHALEREWRRAQRRASPLSLVIADIDDFKPYNDRFGHPAGDVCLKKVAEALSAAARRAGELVARYGGEEFALLLPDVGAEEAVKAAERARHAVAMLRVPHGPSPAGPIVAISLGVASRGDPGIATPGDLVRAADRAMYEAKRQGGDRVVRNPPAD